MHEGVAGALAADYVVHGTLGALGNKLVLTLNLFDNVRGISAGRALAQADSLEGLGDKVPTLVGDLLKELPSSASEKPGDKRPRALVLDIKPSQLGSDDGGARAGAPAPPQAGGSFWTPAGIAVLGVGAASLLGALGVELWAEADRSGLDRTGATQVEASAVQAQRETLQRPLAVVAYSLAAVSGVAGAALLVVGAFE